MINAEKLNLALIAEINKGPCKDHACFGCQVIEHLVKNSRIKQYTEALIVGVAEEGASPEELVIYALTMGITIGKTYSIMVRLGERNDSKEIL